MKMVHVRITLPGGTDTASFLDANLRLACELSDDVLHLYAETDARALWAVFYVRDAPADRRRAAVRRLVGAVLRATGITIGPADLIVS